MSELIAGPTTKLSKLNFRLIWLVAPWKNREVSGCVSSVPPEIGNGGSNGTPRFGTGDRVLGSDVWIASEYSDSRKI